MMTVGLTGGFASGKTTVAKMLKAKGARVLSADEIVHAFLRYQTACARKIVRVFGKGILVGGRIDRRRLGNIVFNDPVQRRTLERIIHPEVVREIRRQLVLSKKLNPKKVFVVEVPLLFEAGLEKNFDCTITVIATRYQQIQRALQTRSLKRQEILHRIQAQLPLSVKRQMADILIDNRGSLSYTRRQVSAIWRTLKKKIVK